MQSEPVTFFASTNAVWELMHPYTDPHKEVRASVRQLIDSRTADSAPPELTLNAAMRHGIETEPEAIAFYERYEGKTVSLYGQRCAS